VESWKPREWWRKIVAVLPLRRVEFQALANSLAPYFDRPKRKAGASQRPLSEYAF